MLLHEIIKSKEEIAENKERIITSKDEIIISKDEIITLLKSENKDLKKKLLPEEMRRPKFSEVVKGSLPRDVLVVKPKKDIQEKLENEYEFEIPKKKNPRIKIIGLKREMTADKEKLINNIILQNGLGTSSD
ncbi:hypothetical protein HHI36_023585 [Cryptolaemus montrouzieri]|uniref:Uncharacterized protein n=1 Tax=Cryptolaemus montrouzieri TaxID=559131 RepID=A0ABD2PH70_9CUCU